MSVSVPRVYNGMYLGNMSFEQASMTLAVRDSKVIPNLKNMIFDFPVDILTRSIEEQKSIRKMLADDGKNIEDYISSLRDYQTVGTAFMYMSPRSILADGVGLGKTVEISALINYLKYRGELTRFLIAVENSAVTQTQYELMRFTGLNVVSLPSDSVKMRRAINNTNWNEVDGIVIKHSSLRSDVFSKWLSLNLVKNSEGYDVSSIFNTFFLDESSVIKNDTTKIYNYTRNICNLVSRIHLLNATAFETRLMDVYYQCDMMNDVLLPKKYRIDQEFCTYKRAGYWTSVKGEHGEKKPQKKFSFKLDGYKNQAKFKESLKLFYFGRCKADIGLDRPHVYKVYEVEPNPNQCLAMEKGYRYMEVLNCPSLIPDIKMETTRDNVPKLDRLCNLVENEFADSSVMIYCFHLEAQRAIEREMRNLGRKPVILSGETKDEERYIIQQGFNNGDYDVIITNVKKSLNLYGGDVCIFYTAITNPASMFQAAGRIDRNVDDKIKTFVLMLYKGTDEYRFFTDVVKQRAKDARDLTIDAKTTVDMFIESMEEELEQ